MISIRTGWLAMTASLCLLIIVSYINSQITTRKAELESYSNTFRFEIASAKHALSEKSFEIAQDQTLTDAVNMGHSNSFSSKLSGWLESEKFTHVGVYNKKCGEIFQNSLKQQSKNICDQQQTDQLYWVENGGSPIISITRNLGSEHLVSLGLIVDKPWVEAALGNLESKYLGLMQPDIKADLEKAGAFLNYSTSHEPILFDNHFLTKHLKHVTAPFQKDRTSETPFLIVFICATAILIFGYINQKTVLQTKILETKALVSQHANKLGLDSRANERLVLSEWESRVKELSEKFVEESEKVDNLNIQVRELELAAVEHSKNEAVSLQIGRSLSKMIDNLEVQKESLDVIKTCLDVGIKDNVKTIKTTTHEWNEKVLEKGPRKFLRSSFETVSKQSPEMSIFEYEIGEIIKKGSHLEGALIAMSKELTTLKSKENWTRRIYLYWQSLIGLDHKSAEIKKVSDPVNQAIAQVEVTASEIVSIDMPNWTEPPVTIHIPSQILTCILYEVMDGLLSKDCSNKINIHYRSGSMRDQIVISKVVDKHQSLQTENPRLNDALNRARSFAKIYGVTVKPLAGTGQYTAISIAWAPHSGPSIERQQITYQKTRDQQFENQSLPV